MLRRQLYYWIMLFWKEKLFVFFSVLQLGFSIFFLGFAGAQMEYGKEIVGSSWLEKDKIYILNKLDRILYRSNALDLELIKWFDEEQKCFSFLTSTKTGDGKNLIVCIGQNSAKLFSSFDLECGKAYGYTEDKMMDKMEHIEIKAGEKKYLYKLIYLDKMQDRVLISKGIHELENTIILCISCHDFLELFNGYYYSEFWNNIHFENDDLNIMGLFLEEMQAKGYDLVPVDRALYIDRYWGEILESGLLFGIFFLVVTLFLVYGLYIHMIFMMNRNARMNTIQYICGERDVFIWLRAYTLMLSIVLMSVVAATSILKMIDFPKWEQIHIIVLFMIGVLCVIIGVKTKIMFRSSHYEKYLKSER